MRWRECSLLDLGEIIFRVAVQGEPAKPAQWHLFLRPDLGQVENVPAELLRLFWTQDLHVAGPGRMFASRDRLKQVLCMPVWDR
jgi:hypothetical protein